jgi:hypothetical protein
MTKDKSKKSDQTLEGEGSYSATRRYNAGLAQAVASGELEAGAQAARQAMAGPEGKELKRAAEQAKKGPKQAAKANRPAARK